MALTTKDDFGGLFIGTPADETTIEDWGFTIISAVHSAGVSRYFTYCKLSVIKNLMRVIRPVRGVLPYYFWQLPKGIELTDDVILRGPNSTKEVFFT